MGREERRKAARQKEVRPRPTTPPAVDEEHAETTPSEYDWRKPVPASSVLRYFAYFDILGWKKTVEESSHDYRILESIYRLVEKAVNVAATAASNGSRSFPESVRRPRLRWLQYSDTFLVYDDPLDDQSDESSRTAAFMLVTTAARWVFLLLSALEIPVRGVVACAPLLVRASDLDLRRTSVYGEGLTAVAELEKYCKWLGVGATKDSIPSGWPEDGGSGMGWKVVRPTDRQSQLPAVYPVLTFGQPELNDDEAKIEALAAEFFLNSLDRRARVADFSSDIVAKYTATVRFLTHELHADSVQRLRELATSSEAEHGHAGLSVPELAARGNELPPGSVFHHVLWEREVLRRLRKGNAATE